ncbi:MAG: C40 family peptidase [Bacteroidota bacterium]|nr:C40 family peptidase [Bacteroidota bacterium]
MSSVICPLSIVPVRKDANDRSEMVTQWLFGETAEIMEKNDKWTRLQFDHDGYEGWVSNNQIAPCTTPNFDPDLRVMNQHTVVDLGERQVLMPYGGVLPFYDSGHILWQDRRVPVNAVTNRSVTGDRAELIDIYLHPFLGAPYLWGGRTPAGVDCSGLVQMIFMLMGIYLARDASAQADEGDEVTSLDQAVPGDLAFFGNEEGKITHVGIVLQRIGEEGAFIAHASGRVRIDRLDDQGIFNAEEQSRTHMLRAIRRVS